MESSVEEPDLTQPPNNSTLQAGGGGGRCCGAFADNYLNFTRRAGHPPDTAEKPWARCVTFAGLSVCLLFVVVGALLFLSASGFYALDAAAPTYPIVMTWQWPQCCRSVTAWR